MDKKSYLSKRTIIEKDGQTIDTYTVKAGDNEYKYKIQFPTFEQIASAVQVAYTGGVNMAAAGKVIFNLCCSECSPELLEPANARLLVSVCINLFDVYVIPVEVEIKKN